MGIDSVYEIKAFKGAKEWRGWLEMNHDSCNGIWIMFYKKASGMASVTYDEALEEALCYGWIDGQIKKYDELSYIQKFTPRRARSMWSKRNIKLAEGLTENGKMTAAGLKEIEKAKDEGRWDIAYDSPGNAKIPEEFMKMLSKNKKADLFFKTLNKTNLYSIAWRIQTAKRKETKDKRMEMILKMLEKGERFY